MPDMSKKKQVSQSVSIPTVWETCIINVIIVPQLAEVVDSISISLNEATAEKYEKVTRPSFPHAYEAMLDFAEECGKLIPHTQLSIVDILPEEDIKACQRIADSRGVHLKVRPWEHSA